MSHIWWHADQRIIIQSIASCLSLFKPELHREQKTSSQLNHHYHHLCCSGSLTLYGIICRLYNASGYNLWPPCWPLPISEVEVPTGQNPLLPVRRWLRKWFVEDTALHGLKFTVQAWCFSRYFLFGTKNFKLWTEEMHTDVNQDWIQNPVMNMKFPLNEKIFTSHLETGRFWIETCLETLGTMWKKY